MSAKLGFIDPANKVVWISFDPEGSAPEAMHLSLRHHGVRFVPSDNLMLVGIPFTRVDPKDPAQKGMAEGFAAWAVEAVGILTKNRTTRHDCDRFFHVLKAIQNFQGQGVPA
jgi:hypothetical protein